MLQFYFLSVLLNVLTGFTLVFVRDKETSTVITEKFAVITGQTFRLVLGILTFGTGFFKLLTVVRGDVPIIGDLLPAVAGLAGGFTLLCEYYLTHSTVDNELPQFLQTLFVSGKRYVGILALCAGLLHFLFYSVLFL